MADVSTGEKEMVIVGFRGGLKLLYFAGGHSVMCRPQITFWGAKYWGEGHSPQKTCMVLGGILISY